MSAAKSCVIRCNPDNKHDRAHVCKWLAPLSSLLSCLEQAHLGSFIPACRESTHHIVCWVTYFLTRPEPCNSHLAAPASVSPSTFRSILMMRCNHVIESRLRIAIPSIALTDMRSVVPDDFSRSSYSKYQLLYRNAFIFVTKNIIRHVREYYGIYTNF